MAGEGGGGDEGVGAWKLRLEMQQARSGNTSTNTA